MAAETSFAVMLTPFFEQPSAICALSLGLRFVERVILVAKLRRPEVLVDVALA